MNHIINIVSGIVIAWLISRLFLRVIRENGRTTALGSIAKGTYTVLAMCTVDEDIEKNNLYRSHEILHNGGFCLLLKKQNCIENNKIFSVVGTFDEVWGRKQIEEGMLIIIENYEGENKIKIIGKR